MTCIFLVLEASLRMKVTHGGKCPTIGNYGKQELEPDQNASEMRAYLELFK